MKKIIAFIVAMLMLTLSLTACVPGMNNGTDEHTKDSSKQTEAPTAGKAKITKLTINGKEQSLETTSIEYTLSAGEVKIPVVAAEKSDGEGELMIEQAKAIPGTATVTLNEVTYMIQFKTNFIYEQSALQNTYHKLASDGNLNVAYIGGSVTVGAFGDAGKSYRDLTTKWFRENFEDAKIVETNAGIGGTGSFWGSYRAIDHLKLKSKVDRPDLVFIEFAVNDYYDGTTPDDIKCYADTMIGEIYRANPHADIIILLVGEQFTINAPSTETWRAVAAHYNLPCIELVKRLVEDMQENGKPWNYYVADSVHPNNNGYAMYASYIAEFLHAELVDKQVNPFNSYEKELPDTTLSGKPMRDLAYYETYRLLLPSGTGFAAHIENGDEIAAGIAAKTVGAKLEFTFSGTGVVLSIDKTTPRGIVLEYTIDGEEYTDVKTDGTLKMTLAEGLENGTHTVSIRVKSISSGMFRIQRILVQGNTTRAGIKIV